MIPRKRPDGTWVDCCGNPLDYKEAPEMDDGRVLAPWTDEQVEALKRYQTLGYVHELTCPNGHYTDDKNVLQVTKDYLYCEVCHYKQIWVPWVCISMGINSENPLKGWDFVDGRE